MKTVTGGVIAAEPISLPKAATILSRFVSSENSASQDVGAYLRRASVALSELKSLHAELKVMEVEIENENERRKERRKKRKSDRDMHSEEKKSKKKSRS